ncbi:MAG: dTMP kinase [Campylobacterales bacterium]|nr:dTMP kinase [Campylobacterales bacterium]
MVVLFEGIDTCGKTTQIELLAQKHPEFITTKEPTNKFREILLSGKLAPRAELLLFLADRAQHYSKVIEPNRDKTIISDRGFVSGMAYALANGSHDFEWLLKLNQFALHNHLPDKIVLFITTLETLKSRLGEKSLDGIEERGLDYLMSVQANMLEVVKALDREYLIIDANESIEAIHQQIVEFI